jgi:Putative DNA-binding domain
MLGGDPATCNDFGVTEPGPFLFKVDTEQDLQDAIDNGLTETHHLDFKRELGLNDKAKKDLAIDIASLAVHGGTLIIGVDEEDKTAPPKLSPVDLTGLAERVVQIAGMRPDPGIAIRTSSVPSASGNNLGCLFVQVRPSPQAPHQVDGRYYGRADKTNRILSDAEVERLISQRITQQRDTLADARAALGSLVDSLPGGIADAPPMMLLLAEPLGVCQDDPLVALTEADSMQQDVLELVRAAVVAEHQQFAPSLKSVARVVRRANAVAATTDFQDGEPFPGSERTVELRLHESGRIVLASRRPVVFPNSADGKPQVFEVAIVGHTDLLVHLTALVSQRYGFAGSWRFGLVVTGVRGATSYALSEPPFYESGHRYTDGLYGRATSASLEELEQAPQQVVRRLVSPLLRSVGSHQLQQWEWLSP